MIFFPFVNVALSVAKIEIYFLIVPQGIIELYKCPLDRRRIVFYVRN